MKKIFTFCWIVLGLVWVHESRAQQDVGAVANVNASSAPVRAKDKDEIADEQKANWEQLKQSFRDRKRRKGPFGGKMDPGVPDEIVPVAESTVVKKEMKVVKKVASLQEAVNKFQVNGVNPKKQMVMVGFRPVHRGDIVEIEHDGELFKLRIVKVTKDEVVFMNIKNKEEASVQLGVVIGVGSSSQKGGNAIETSIIKKNKPVRFK